METASKYTCSDYRQEMILMGLKNRLNQQDLSDEERDRIIEEIKKLESAMEMD
ncbi:MAG: biliverdin-producing heme oxygenase [Desulfobacteraceae bacterium]|nr:biliverdin-producing heme oxygenase [Desulfobacteraceae bacterium]MCP4348282.1 biliverdin-producing heme oxygenase [Desulfobacterales bacterium]